MTNKLQDVVEPFDVWWPKYLQGVNESAAAAERHLNIPAGTISSIPSDPDFIATVKAYAVVEPLLNDLIATWPPQKLGLERNEYFRTFVTALNVRGNTGKLELAGGLGLLAKSQIRFIKALAQIRHRYAHNVKNMHRSLTEILMEEQKNNQRILGHLTGLRNFTLPLDLDVSLDYDTNRLAKSFMYYRLTDFLATVLDTLRPPPPRPGGLLGALLTEG